MKYLLLLVFVALHFTGYTQTCTGLGQNPTSAFPVCANTTFSQSSVAICGSAQIPTPCRASGSIFLDKNPYWYKFTCFKAGTLGFEITPINLQDDYDWQVFDITGKNANNVYSDKSMFVACNWSGEGGKTGASVAGNSLAVCEGPGQPLYSKMPGLVEGHEYLLLVSHFTDSQSGYSLTFGGGSASIVDSTLIDLVSARPSCDGKTISIKINKKISCSSLASDGSDFSLNSASSKIINAAGINCNGSFDMDSLVLQLDQPLAPGSYTITSKKGSDQNTLLDNCKTPMAEGLFKSFVINYLQPTPFDSIAPLGCAPQELVAVFKKPIQCASVSADGSDFVIDPSSGVNIIGATTTCTNNVSSTIVLKLSAPIKNKGTYKVSLVNGLDGNTIVDECAQVTPLGNSVFIATSDTVSAKFSSAILYGCKSDTVMFSHAGANNVNSWSWKFNNRGTSIQQNPMLVSTQYGAQTISLAVSNGVCRDSTLSTIVLDNELKANFSGPSLICPTDDALFKDSSIGKILVWNWDFGIGTFSQVKDPPLQKYLPGNTAKTYPVRLVVKNDHNCYDTITKTVTVLTNCYIAVASAFTPNGDGLNDYLYPINAFKATNLLFRVYNRLGQLLFETNDFTSKWDGTYKGVQQPSGAYVYILQYTHADTGKPYFVKGTSVLIR